MGCGGSKTPDTPPQAAQGKGAAGDAASKGKEKNTNQNSNAGTKLLDKYTLGEVLGQGAFGVVYACEKKGTKEQYAVKMVDMAESPLVEIKKECDMLKMMAHPCVVKLHDVYYEKVFVCMVLDIIKGGDMINGMQAYWQSKGTIPCETTQNVSKQMLTAIKVLHDKNVVHRDLKGDNFLMDRKDIENPGTRIFLSDFGTVVPCDPGQRLSTKCGTKLYWSPEFYSLNYSIPVDIWAIGVIMYGLVTGRFPFKGETDVRTKPLKLPSKFPKEGQELIMAMLEREDSKRLTAGQCLEKPFMAMVKSAAWEELDKLEAGFKPEMKEFRNLGVAQRRDELVQRLKEANNAIGARASMVNTVADISKVEGFDVTNPTTNGVTTYEWKSPADVTKDGLMDAAAKLAKLEDFEHATDAQVESIHRQLDDHQIKTTEFGKGQAKTMKEFAVEVLTGSSRLMIDAAKHKNIVRVVDVVLLRVVHTGPQGKRILIKKSEQYPDGRTRDNVQLPGTKKEPHENGVQTAKRILDDRLGMADCQISFDWSTRESFEEEEESPSYPGVRTVYRKEIYEGILNTNDDAILTRVGAKGSGQLKKTDAKNYVRNYAWCTEAQCEKEKVVYKAPKDGTEISSLVAPPVGFEEEQLEAFLANNHVDVSQFGQGTNRSLQEFATELVSGEALLQKRNGKVTRIVDVVVVYITKKDGTVLVENKLTVNGAVNKLNRLPAVKRRSDENMYLAAHRLITKTLRVNENFVNIQKDGVKYLEEEKESKGYCGLPTLYQKRFIMASLVE